MSWLIYSAYITYWLATITSSLASLSPLPPLSLSLSTSLESWLNKLGRRTLATKSEWHEIVQGCVGGMNKEVSTFRCCFSWDMGIYCYRDL